MFEAVGVDQFGCEGIAETNPSLPESLQAGFLPHLARADSGAVNQLEGEVLLPLQDVVL